MHCFIKTHNYLTVVEFGKMQNSPVIPCFQVSHSCPLEILNLDLYLRKQNMYLSELYSISKSSCRLFSGGQLPGNSSLFVAETVEAETSRLENETIIKLRIGEKAYIYCCMYYCSFKHINSGMSLTFQICISCHQDLVCIIYKCDKSTVISIFLEYFF